MLYNTFDDTIMEPIGWLFEVLSGVLYLPFQFNADTIIAGLIVITPIAAGALCLIIDWVFDVRDEFSNFHRLEDYTSSFRQHFQRYGRSRQSRVDLKALKEYQDYKHNQAMELQEKKHAYTHDYLQQQMAHTKIKNAMQAEQSTRFSQNIDKLKNYQEYKFGKQQEALNFFQSVAAQYQNQSSSPAALHGGSVPSAVPASYKPKRVNGAPVPPGNHPELDIEVD